MKRPNHSLEFLWGDLPKLFKWDPSTKIQEYQHILFPGHNGWLRDGIKTQAGLREKQAQDFPELSAKEALWLLSL